MKGRKFFRKKAMPNSLGLMTVLLLELFTVSI